MTNKEREFIISCIDFCQANANMPDADMVIANGIVKGLQSEMAGNLAVEHRLRRAVSIPTKVLNEYASKPVVDWNRELRGLMEDL